MVGKEKLNGKMLLFVGRSSLSFFIVTLEIRKRSKCNRSSFVSIRVASISQLSQVQSSKLHGFQIDAVILYYNHT